MSLDVANVSLDVPKVSLDVANMSLDAANVSLDVPNVSLDVAIQPLLDVDRSADREDTIRKKEDDECPGLDLLASACEQTDKGQTERERERERREKRREK